MAEPESLTEGVVPPISPPPPTVRDFTAEPWHRPRKQYIRTKQWNEEIERHVIQKMPTGESLIRILGLPSTEFLDLLSMRTIVEGINVEILYLGFDSNRKKAADVEEPAEVVHVLNTERLIDTSSFVHGSSKVVGDLFEAIPHPKSMSRTALEPFEHFDVINLDLCGCIVKNGEDATQILDSVEHLLYRQSSRRLKPWLLFLTTFAAPAEINRVGCRVLVEAIQNNAERSSKFDQALKDAFAFSAAEISEIFRSQEAPAPEASIFLKIFAVAISKWLAAKLHDCIPPSVVSLLKGLIFRHDGRKNPELISLSFLVEPKPSAGGISKDEVEQRKEERYDRAALKIVRRCFEKVEDLDAFLQKNNEIRAQMADEIEELLLECGLNEEQVKMYLNQFR